jgi:hypothetical protein
VTDPRGRFELAGASAGRHVLGIRAQGFPALSQDVKLPESTDLGVLTLKAGGAIAGIVLDPSGGPVCNARVWIAPSTPAVLAMVDSPLPLVKMPPGFDHG